MGDRRPRPPARGRWLQATRLVRDAAPGDERVCVEGPVFPGEDHAVYLATSSNLPTHAKDPPISRERRVGQRVRRSRGTDQRAVCCRRGRCPTVVGDDRGRDRRARGALRELGFDSPYLRVLLRRREPRPPRKIITTSCERGRPVAAESARYSSPRTSAGTTWRLTP